MDLLTDHVRRLCHFLDNPTTLTIFGELHPMELLTLRMRPSSSESGNHDASGVLPVEYFLSNVPYWLDYYLRARREYAVGS